MTRRRRPCLVCGALTPASRCPVHTVRNYGPAHTRARAALLSRLPTPCAYCGHTIRTPAELVAAHVVDGQPAYGWQPAHPACNEQAKRRKA